MKTVQGGRHLFLKGLLLQHFLWCKTILPIQNQAMAVISTVPMALLRNENFFNSDAS
jgi:hypothetical protein